MNNKLSLKNRLLFSYLLLSILICTVFITVFKFAEEFIEEELIYPKLNYELNRFINKEISPLEKPPPGLSFYQQDNIPEAFIQLTPQNNMQEMMLDGKEVAVVVHESHGEKFIVIDDQSIFEHIELIVFITLLLASFFAIISAWLFGKIAIGQVISPLSILANEVKSDAARPVFSTTSTDEIGLLARSIEERNRKLQDFLDRERVFSSDVSHELRTPLTVILGASEILSTNLADQPKLLVVANRITRTAIDTTEQISALLLLSRSPQYLATADIYLQELIQEQIQQCQILLSGKSVALKFVVEENAHIHTQVELAAIAFRNLIRNACQYTDNGTITITLHSDKFIIEDTGCGIAADMQLLLFQRHARSSQTQSGFGFGLSIVKRIIDHLHWSILFEEPISGGSRFVVYFAVATKTDLIDLG